MHRKPSNSIDHDRQREDQSHPPQYLDMLSCVTKITMMNITFLSLKGKQQESWNKVFHEAKMHHLFSARALPQIPLGVLMIFPRIP